MRTVMDQRSVLSEMPWMTKPTAGRLPLPVNVLVVLGHQRRRSSRCAVLLEVQVKHIKDSDIHAYVLNPALLRARILQLLLSILKHPMHIQYEVYMDYPTRLIYIRRLVVQLASAAG
jgi:hypothetical protein